MAFLEIEGLGKINYHEYGSGEKLLFAFHGYGVSGDHFKVLQKSILKKYRVIAFDHFFHGETKLYDLKEASILAGMQPGLLKSYIENWFKLYGRQRFSLMGYSIGANMALYVLENFAELVDDVFLIAPDGLVPHTGFNFLRTSFIGKKLYRKLTYSSWAMTGMLKLLKKIGVIDDSLFIVAHRQTRTLEKRLIGYFTVHFTKNIRPDISKIAALINQHKINCHLFFGRYDYLFPQKNSRKLLTLTSRPIVHVLPADHWLVTAELDDYLTRLPL